MEELAETFGDAPQCTVGAAECSDDMFLSDSTTAVPTLWFRKKCKSGFPSLWHNSAQAEEGFLEPKPFADYTALAAVWFQRVLWYTGEPAKRRRGEIRAITSPWREYAAQQIYARAGKGLPYDLIRIPKDQRRHLPDGVLYGPMASLLAETDGRKNLAQIILETEADRRCEFTDAQIKKYIDAFNYLADWGYLTAVKRTELTSDMLADALHRAGVASGDLLLVHSSLSKCGYMAGGAEALIRSDIREGNSYVCVNDGGIVIGTFFYVCGEDIEPTYREITEGEWLDGSPYGVVHRLAGDGSEKGIGAFCLNWAFEQCGHLRIDTHGDNIVMQNLVRKLGFVRCGTIYVEEDLYPRLAYEKTGFRMFQ